MSLVLIVYTLIYKWTDILIKDTPKVRSNAVFLLRRITRNYNIKNSTFPPSFPHDFERNPATLIF